MGKRVLIVGGVAGGASAAARLRRLDEEAEIILFERGNYISFANCGLPYHVGGVIKDREELLLVTPSDMKRKYNIEVRILEEAVHIDRQNRRLTLRRADGSAYEESYDYLVLATGASPAPLPIPGIESDRVLRLFTLPDADRIVRELKEKKAGRAVVAGGGFIGLEAAENLRHAGLEVTLVEMADQVLPPLDPEMAKPLERELRKNGVTLLLSKAVSEFREEKGGLSLTLSGGEKLEADFCVLAAGVRPNSALAREAGLALGARGGILTDEHMRTSDERIYAAGDVAEVKNFVTGEKDMIPLAGPANKQGRIAADNIAGLNSVYKGSQGTSIVKVFSLAAASTGVNEKTLCRLGKEKGKDYETVIVSGNPHASYYPGAESMLIKLLFSPDGKKLFGAQIVGRDGVDKRIDVIATLLRMGGGVSELSELELAYAPPYGSAKDAVNMAGFTAENLIAGKVAFSDWNFMDAYDPSKTTVIDVREADELAVFGVPGALHIPLGEVRSRMGELDKEKEIVIFCAAGIRAYNAGRILMQNGFKDVKVYPGGTRFYRQVR